MRARRERRAAAVARGGVPDRRSTGSRRCSTDVPADAQVAIEETFGPIAPVVAIDSLEQAIALTNASPYGLLAAIFTADLAAGLEFADRVRTGWVNINESSNYWEAHLPFGGRAGSDSGIGRVGGAHVMQSFTELQTVVLTPRAVRRLSCRLPSLFWWPVERLVDRRQRRVAADQVRAFSASIIVGA